MRIFQITKRQYTNKDLIDDKYGRLYELPNLLARRGHEVIVFCLSYRKKPVVTGITLTNTKNAPRWYSRNLLNSVFPDLLAYFMAIIRLAQHFKPDLVLSSSDCLHVIAGSWLSKRFAAPHVIDLYDNYESFALSKIPGIKLFFKMAVNDASAVICVSEKLSDYVCANYKPLGEIHVIENAVPKCMFHKMHRGKCREELGLPLNAKIIGTAGALSQNRGIEDLYKAFELLAAERKDIHLLLAGKKDPRVLLPDHPNVHYLGQLAYETIPKFINALDVAVICNKESDFGTYCFPQKAYEILACEVPIVAANVGAVKTLLKDYPCCLYPVSDINGLENAIKSQLEHRIVPKIPIATWDEQADKLGKILTDLHITN